MIPLLLTDKNIDLIAGNMRALLQKHAMQIEADIAAGKSSLLINLDLKLSADPSKRYAELTMNYVPLTRNGTVKTALEDPRQTTFA